jgi:hypothetical protein
VTRVSHQVFFARLSNLDSSKLLLQFRLINSVLGFDALTFPWGTKVTNYARTVCRFYNEAIKLTRFMFSLLALQATFFLKAHLYTLLRVEVASF